LGTTGRGGPVPIRLSGGLEGAIVILLPPRPGGRGPDFQAVATGGFRKMDVP